jgi:hypothetical protein
MWGAKQQQLNEAMEQQAELAAGVFERWLDAQRQPLLTVGSLAGTLSALTGWRASGGPITS